jgi:alpha-galactosidase
VLGKCLQARNGQTTPGTPVEIWDCNGGGSQQWRVNADGTVTSVQSGLCLEVNGTGSNSPVRLWTCSGGAGQQWTRR